MDDEILEYIGPYFMDLFERLPRGGPGNRESTLKALGMMTGLPSEPEALDIGCGPGAQTLDLARATNARITAFDLHDPFVHKLATALNVEGFSDRVEARVGDMRCLAQDYEAGSMDLIWSEGALYFIGFENALRECFRILRPGGYFGATDGCWLVPKEDIPEEAKGFWGDFSETTGVPEHIEMFRRTGFELIDHFTLPLEAWTVDFYGPMEQELDRLEIKNKDIPDAVEFYGSQRKEIENINRLRISRNHENLRFAGIHSDTRLRRNEIFEQDNRFADCERRLCLRRGQRADGKTETQQKERPISISVQSVHRFSIPLSCSFNQSYSRYLSVSSRIKTWTCAAKTISAQLVSD